MSTPVSVNFKAMPLESVVEHLQTMTDINFDLDLRGLKEGNVDPKQPITANLKDVSLKSALTIICQQAGLKHVIENEAIRITHAEGRGGPADDQVDPGRRPGHPGPELRGARPGCRSTDRCGWRPSTPGHSAGCRAAAARCGPPGACRTGGTGVSGRSDLPGHGRPDDEHARWTAGPAPTPGRPAARWSAS